MGSMNRILLKLCGGTTVGAASLWAQDRGQGRPVVPRHRDRDEVGKVCAQIIF